MQLTVRTQDSLTPNLIRRLNLAANPGKAVEAGLEVIAQIAKRAFNTPSLRPSPWANKADGTPATLRLHQVLARSPRVIMSSKNEGTVGSDRHYAAIHQLGGRTPAHVIRPKTAKALRFVIGGRVIFVKSVTHPGSAVPARPYFPFYADGSLTTHARTRVEAAMEIKLR
jgi:phage gpG-like protein